MVLAAICFGIAPLALQATTALAQRTALTYDPTFDPIQRFNWGLGGSVGNAYGALVATQPNSDIVVASLVPPCGQGDESNGLFTVGLELFSADVGHKS